MARPLDDLQRDQLAILDAYRAVRESSGDAGPSCSSVVAGGEIAFGRVVDVIDSDPVHGPHLLVRRLAWCGTPPSAIDVGVAPIRCYPTPIRSVNSFQPDDFVRVCTIDGAAIAEQVS